MKTSSLPFLIIILLFMFANLLSYQGFRSLHLFPVNLVVLIVLSHRDVQGNQRILSLLVAQACQDPEIQGSLFLPAHLLCLF